MKTKISVNSFLIIGEFRGLSIPCSMEIKKSPTTSYYLYRGDLINKLDEVDDIIAKYRSDSYEGKISSPEYQFFIEKTADASAFIISGADFPIDGDPEQLILDAYEKMFNPFLNCISLLFEEIFRFNNIWYFEKTSDGQWQLTRMIQIYSDPEFPTSNSTLMQFARVDEYEIFFPSLIARLICQKKYDPIFYELSVVKTKIQHVEINILLYWMMLEHLTQTFFQDKKRGEFIERKAFSEFRENCLKNLTLIEKKDINYEAPEKLLARLENYPPIKDQINSMCRKIGYKKDVKEDVLIKLFYDLRSEIVHMGFNRDVLHRILQKYNKDQDTRFVDILEQTSKFEMLIEKIFLAVLGFTPHYLAF